jgi:hypothetical protein
LSAEKYSGIKGTGKVPLSKYLKKQTGRSVEQTVPRKEFFYWSDNGDLRESLRGQPRTRDKLR